MAGSGAGTFADGVGTKASFNNPVALVIDSVGTVYIADYSNHRIRVMNSDGQVTTLAGSTSGSMDGVGTTSRLSNPVGLAVDLDRNIYVVGFSEHRIRVINSAGLVTTLAGSSQGYTDGLGTAAQFYNPSGIALDAATMTFYVAEYGNNRLRVISSTGLECV